MDPTEIEKAKKVIDGMSQMQMASLWRFAPIGHPYFSNRDLSQYFQDRFKNLGGFTPEISKSIGVVCFTLMKS